MGEDIRNITYNGERSQIPRRQLSGHHSAPRPSLASLRRGLLIRCEPSSPESPVCNYPHSSVLYDLNPDVIATSSSRTSRDIAGFFIIHASQLMIKAASPIAHLCNILGNRPFSFDVLI